MRISLLRDFSLSQISVTKELLTLEVQCFCNFAKSAAISSLNLKKLVLIQILIICAVLLLSRPFVPALHGVSRAPGMCVSTVKISTIRVVRIFPLSLICLVALFSAWRILFSSSELSAISFCSYSRTKLSAPQQSQPEFNYNNIY
jgi:magnesium-transporting ATPase (P-type)